MTIKASLDGGSYEPARATYKMGSGECDTCGSRQPHEHQELQSLAAAIGHDDTPPYREQPVRVEREYSRPDYGSALREPWHHAYGAGGKT